MNTPLEEQVCKNCRYRMLRKYREMTQEFSYFQCRRNAPQPSTKDNVAFWPIVANDDWCGEWVQR